MIFARVMDTAYLHVRLDVVNSKACRKFHVDAVTARLVRTYRGTGMQYGTSPDRSDPAVFHMFPTECPIVLRGTQWPETPGSESRRGSRRLGVSWRAHYSLRET